MLEKQSHNRFQFWKHLCDAWANTEDLMKSVIIFKFSPAPHRQKISKFCKLNMPGKQSYNRVQFSKHFDDAWANTEDLVKSILIFKFSSACPRQKILRFCKLNYMPSYNSVQFWTHFDVASIFIEDWKKSKRFKFSLARRRRKFFKVLLA